MAPNHQEKAIIQASIANDLHVGLFDEDILHWLLFQDEFKCSGEITFASPVSADRINGKTSYVQLLDGSESSGDQQ